MDPASVIGLASSIITFIEFSYKVVNGTLEVSRAGVTTDNVHIALITSDLQAASARLDGIRRSKGEKSKSENAEAIRQLACECRSISDDLLHLLESLKSSSHGSTWRSVRIALRGMGKKGEIGDMERRLEKCRSQLMLRLSLLLEERQVAMEVQLHSFRVESTTGSTDILRRLDSIQSGIASMEETVQASRLEAPDSKLRSSTPTSHDSSLPSYCDRIDTMDIMTSVKSRIVRLLQQTAGPCPEARILKQIYHPFLYSRMDAVQAAYEDTFDWVLKSECESDTDKPVPSPGPSTGPHATALRARKERASRDLVTWLREGKGIFHVSAKAGAGKSTFMKSLLRDSGAAQELQAWANKCDSTLLFGYHFFWNSGHEIQRSLEGLYRSILFEVLIACPDVVVQVFPEAYRRFSSTGAEAAIDEMCFRPEDFSRAFDRLVTVSISPNYRVCFFIDGLDEFNAQNGYEYQKLADRLQAWTSNDNIKLLVTSRPYAQFQHTFSDSQRLRLDELVADDIRVFGTKMFAAQKLAPELETYYPDLVETVVERSEGVFLWARLVVTSLLVLASRHEPVHTLRKKLDTIPRDLDTLYTSILDSLSGEDRFRAFQLLALVATCTPQSPRYKAGFNALSVSWLDDLEAPDFPPTHIPEPYSEAEIASRLLRAECLLGDITKGLLETRPRADRAGSSNFFSKDVQFFHRTAWDFVSKSKAIADFQAEHTDVAGMEAAVRLWAAEATFCSNEAAMDLRLATRWANGIRDINRRHRLLDIYTEAFSRFKLDIPAISMTPFQAGVAIRETNRLGSALHVVATENGDFDYLRNKMESVLSDSFNRQNLSWLFTASLIPRGHGEVTTSESFLESLLNSGMSPNELIPVFTYPFEKTPENYCSVWVAVCTVFAAASLLPTTRGNYYIPQLVRSMECLLKYGARPDCYFLIGPMLEGRRRTRPAATHVISLKLLLSELDVEGLDGIRGLFPTPKRGIFGSIVHLFKTMVRFFLRLPPPPQTGDISDDEPLPQSLRRYDRFHLKMQPHWETRPNANDFYYRCHHTRLVLYSVHCGDEVFQDVLCDVPVA